MSELINAMPIIVSNYAKMFGVKVRMLGTMAYTNGELITLPRLDLNDTLSARVAYGYLAHESAHVRYTDFRSIRRLHRNFTLFTLFNILEDARIERIISREFIGVYENLELIMLYSERLWQQFVADMDEVSSLRLLLCGTLYYASVKSQGFKSQRPKACTLLLKLRARCEHKFIRNFFAQVATIVSCKNTQETLTLAQKLYNLIVAHAPQLLAKKREDLENISEKSEVEVFELLEQEIGHDRSKLLPQMKTEQILAELIPQSMSVKDDMGIIMPGVCKSGREDFIELIEDTRPLRHTLEHKARAWCEGYGMQAQQGRKINVVRAACISAGETRIFKNRLLYEDYSTSIHVLVDVSGSMLFCDDPQAKNRNDEACQAALMIALALENIDGIKTMVTYFPGDGNEFDVALFAHEKASQVASRFDQKAKGSTPLAQALWYAASCARDLRCARNIIFVLTDGVPDSISQTKTALDYIEKMGIETYGIGIKSAFITTLIKNSEVISSTSQLRQVMMRLFTGLFKLPEELS